VISSCAASSSKWTFRQRAEHSCRVHRLLSRRISREHVGRRGDTRIHSTFSALVSAMMSSLSSLHTPSYAGLVAPLVEAIYAISVLFARIPRVIKRMNEKRTLKKLFGARELHVNQYYYNSTACVIISSFSFSGSLPLPLHVLHLLRSRGHCHWGHV